MSPGARRKQVVNISEHKCKHSGAFSLGRDLCTVKMGSCKIGDTVTFSVRVKDAESVFLVGSFNSWSEAHPLEKLSDDLWRTSLSAFEIKDGDSYKFKVRSGDGEVYVADPYAVEFDGAPYYNSVYRDVRCDNLRRLEKNRGKKGFPLNIFSVVSDDFYDGEEHTYKTRELIPYMLQMGFTHLCISEIFEEYYDFKTSKTVKGSFAPRKEHGGVEGLRKMISEMHDSGLAVLLDRGVTKVDDGEGFLIDNARYWLDFYGFDGLVASAESDEAAGVLSDVYGALKDEYKDILFLDGNSFGADVSKANAKIRNHSSDTCAPGAAGDLWNGLQNAMRFMSYSLISSGVGFAEARTVCDGMRYLEDVLGKLDNSVFELFLSDLNALYLAEPCLWKGNSARSEERSGGALVAECCGEEKVVFLIADVSGNGCEVDIPSFDNLRVALDSYSSRYGGQDRIACGVRGNRVTLCAYQSVILIGEAPDKK